MRQVCDGCRAHLQRRLNRGSHSLLEPSSGKYNRILRQLPTVCPVGAIVIEAPQAYIQVMDGRGECPEHLLILRCRLQHDASVGQIPDETMPKIGLGINSTYAQWDVSDMDIYIA